MPTNSQRKIVWTGDGIWRDETTEEKLVRGMREAGSRLSTEKIIGAAAMYPVFDGLRQLKVRSMTPLGQNIAFRSSQKDNDEENYQDFSESNWNK